MPVEAALGYAEPLAQPRDPDRADAVGRHELERRTDPVVNPQARCGTSRVAAHLTRRSRGRPTVRSPIWSSVISEVSPAMVMDASMFDEVFFHDVVIPLGMAGPYRRVWTGSTRRGGHQPHNGGRGDLATSPPHPTRRNLHQGEVVATWVSERGSVEIREPPGERGAQPGPGARAPSRIGTSARGSR